MARSDRNARKTYAVRCYGEGGKGTAVIIVNASECLVGEVVMQYLRAKPEGYRQCAQARLLQVEPHEDSEFSSERVSLELAGIVLEYNYREPGHPDEHIPYLVYVADAEKLADELDELQAKAYEGRGVSCVRSVVFHLRRCDFTSARAVVMNESDKIRSHEEIVAVLERTGLWHRIDFDKWGRPRSA
ncbi:MAG: hypothetical protein IT342_12470 [Candidatus Melainabacteria bacterium]|nr:hypothetical protein [Candidatus Melainabacteria bacterium]